MARVLFLTFFSLIVLFFPADVVLLSLASSSVHVPDTFVLRPPSDGTNRLTVFLPLTRYSVNSTANSSRRHLRKLDSHLPIARMPLHDDLFRNGYYTTQLLIGTPPQKFALIVDTGSTVTYIPCSTCQICGNHQDPRFRPELSTTYQTVKCNIRCTCDKDRKQCTYERQYAEMSTSSGVLGEDVISFGDESELSPQRATFGCENKETGDLYNQRADGIMGLGRGDLSIFDQLVDTGVVSDSFSLCYGGMDVGGGAMVLGGVLPPKDMVFTRSNPIRSPYYNIELKEIHVAGKPLPIDPSVFDKNHGTVLDSGTTYAYLPEVVFLEFKQAIINEVRSLKQIPGPARNFNDICFSGAGSDISELSKSFPTIDMVFENGQKFTLFPENYLFRHSKVRGGYCLGVFQNGEDPTTLLGGIVVRNTFVTYDREHEKIGFWKTNCSELWERLNAVSAPGPGPSTLDGPNSSALFPPGATQDGASPYVIPVGRQIVSRTSMMLCIYHLYLAGGRKVGRITFFMSSSVPLFFIRFQIKNLVPLMADQLNLHNSQLQIMNITSKGKGSLISWAISPGGSDDYMSNTAAISIISRLAKHRVYLPKRFGTYQFSEWMVELVEPPPKRHRTWWQQHHTAVFTTIIITLCISIYATYVWRFRHQAIPYQPVKSAVYEQELSAFVN